jgi:sodium/potassium-transporting ATPase subunit beta
MELNTVWVSCEGENPADVEHIGPIQYIPRRGFPGYFFPFKNDEGYLSPLLAIFFERPKSKKSC